MRRVTPLSPVALVLATFTVVGMLAVPETARATTVGNGRNFGIGFALGSPSSIVGKYFIGSNNAIDFGLAFWNRGRYRYCRDYRGREYWDDCRSQGFSINGDYLWQEPIARGTASLDWHIGVGARMDFAEYYESNLGIAARVPVGLDLTFARPDRLEVFLEIAPAFYIIPATFFDPEAFLGLRFYF